MCTKADVIYLNPLDPTHAIGFNVFDGIDPSDYATFTDEIVASLRHIHHASWGARMDDILTNAVRPLFDLPGESKGTMLGVVRMLNDDVYRKWVVAQCTERTVRDFWQSEFAAWSKSDKSHNLNSSLNKIRRFQSAPVLRNVLGQQRSRIDFGRAIARGQLIVFDFNKWRMGAVNANALASLIMSRLVYEATRRPMPSVEGRVLRDVIIPFGAVVDEFQNVTSLSAVQLLDGIRKYRVSFTFCHQYTDQIDGEILKALNGNVGTKVVFRIGGEDAIKMQRHMDVGKVSDFGELPDYHFIAQFKGGSGVQVAPGRTEPLSYERHGYCDAIRALMRSKYARPVSEIEAQYERWQQSKHYERPMRVVKRGASEGSAKSPHRFSGAAAGMQSLGQIMV